MEEQADDNESKASAHHSIPIIQVLNNELKWSLKGTIGALIINIKLQRLQVQGIVIAHSGTIKYYKGYKEACFYQEDQSTKS